MQKRGGVILMMEGPNDGKLPNNRIISRSYLLKVFCTKPKFKLAKTDLRATFAEQFLHLAFQIVHLAFQNRYPLAIIFYNAF